MNYIIIPVRLASKRLPNKMMLSETGKPLFVHTYENANKLLDYDTKIYIATEDEKIKSECCIREIPYIITKKCDTGTERVYEAVKNMAKPNDIIVNWQGDWPDIDHKLVQKMLVIHPMEMFNNNIYSMYYESVDIRNTVKVVTNQYNQALYFSRQPIPNNGPYKNHIGLYIYQINVLNNIEKLITKFRREDLEQLSWLYYRFSIEMVFSEKKAIGIDTIQDYKEFKKCLLMST